MGAFATDQQLCQDDHRRLEAAVAGDLDSLVFICQRFEVPLLAAAMRSTVSVEESFSLVESTLSALCDELLAGRLAPGEWSSRTLQLLAAYVPEDVDPDDSSHEDHQSLSVIGSVPRVARRRALRHALPRLELPELTALLLSHYRGASPAEMVGLAAETEEAAQRLLEQAQRRLDEALVQVPSPRDDSD